MPLPAPALRPPLRSSDEIVVLRRSVSSARPPPSPKPQLLRRRTVTLHHAFKPSNLSLPQAPGPTQQHVRRPPARGRGRLHHTAESVASPAIPPVEPFVKARVALFNNGGSVANTLENLFVHRAYRGLANTPRCPPLGGRRRRCRWILAGSRRPRRFTPRRLRRRPRAARSPLSCSHSRKLEK